MDAMYVHPGQVNPVHPVLLCEGILRYEARVKFPFPALPSGCARLPKELTTRRLALDRIRAYNQYSLDYTVERGNGLHESGNRNRVEGVYCLC